MRACVFLADGFEEIEGLTVVDMLSRCGDTDCIHHGEEIGDRKSSDPGYGG